jgi:hypothetical protein
LIQTQALKEQINQHNDTGLLSQGQKLDKSTSKFQAAQLHMPTIIPVKFHDFRLNIF